MANLYRKIFKMQGCSVHVITLTWMSCVCVTHLIAIEKLDLIKTSTISFDEIVLNTKTKDYLFSNHEEPNILGSPMPQEENLPLFSINFKEIDQGTIMIKQATPQYSLAVTKDPLLQSGFLLLSKECSPFYHSLSFESPILENTWVVNEPFCKAPDTLPSVELNSWLQASTLSSNIKTIIKRIGVALPSKEEFHISLNIDEEKKGNIAFLLNDPKALISVLAVDPNFKHIAEERTFKIAFQLAHFENTLESEETTYFPAYEVQNVYDLSSDDLSLTLANQSSSYFYEFTVSQENSLLEELKPVPKNPELFSLNTFLELDLPLLNIENPIDYLQVHKKSTELHAKLEANLTAFNSLLMVKSLHFLSPKPLPSLKEPVFTFEKLKDRKPIFVERLESSATQKIETSPHVAIAVLTKQELKLKEVPFDIKPLPPSILDPSSEVQETLYPEPQNAIALTLSSFDLKTENEAMAIAELPLIEELKLPSSQKKETSPYLAIDSLENKELRLKEVPFDIKPLASHIVDPLLEHQEKLYPEVEKGCALELLLPNKNTPVNVAVEKSTIDLDEIQSTPLSKAIAAYSEHSTQEKLNRVKESAYVAVEMNTTFCFEDFMNAYQTQNWAISRESLQKFEVHPVSPLSSVCLTLLETKPQIPMFVIGDQLATNFLKLEKAAKHAFESLLTSQINIPPQVYKRLIPQSKAQYFEELTKKLPAQFVLSYEKNKTGVQETCQHVLRSLPTKDLKDPSYVSLLLKNEEEFDPMRLCSVTSQDKQLSEVSRGEFLKKKALDYLALMPTLQQLDTYVLSTEFRNETEVIASPDGTAYYFAIKLRPFFPDDLRTIHQNFYFVIDQSRNISEERFESFKKSVIRALPYLHTDATFNIVILNKHCDVLNSTNLSYSKETLDETKQFLGNISFGYLAPPQDYTKALQFIEEKFHPNPTELNNIILLTDGSAYKNYHSQKEKISQFCSQNKSHFNIYTVASAQDCHTNVLDLMSYHNNGQMLYSKSNAALPRQLAILIKNLKSPIATNVHLTSLCQEVEELEFFPPSGYLPALYAEQPFVIYGKADRLGEIDLMIQGKVEDEWVNICQKINLRQAKKGDRELLRNCQLMEKKMHYFTERALSDET